MTNIQFNKYYKFFNILSLSLILVSLILLVIKGLNYGVDFKGGTLIELRTSEENSNISKIARMLWEGMGFGSSQLVRALRSRHEPKPYLYLL